jgi:hypothetical protein
MINTLKKEIVTQLSSISNVQAVYDYERSNFTGFPAATVTCSGNENEYDTTASNMRTFAFTIRLYEQIEDVPQLDNISDNAKERAERIMGDLIGAVLEKFDEFYLFNSQADYMLATPSAWGYVKLASGWCRVAEVNLSVKKEFIYS